MRPISSRSATTAESAIAEKRSLWLQFAGLNNLPRRQAARVRSQALRGRSARARRKAHEQRQAGARHRERRAGLENALAMCIGCHGIPGYKTAFPDVYHVPKIAGQQPGYIVNALKAYKSGERSHPSMRGIAASLTEEDMKELAEYYGGGEVKGYYSWAARLRRFPPCTPRAMRKPARQGRAGLRRVPRPGGQQAFGPDPADPRRSALRLPGARADRLQDRPAQQPDHEGLRRAALEAGHRGPRRLVREPEVQAARPAVKRGQGPIRCPVGIAQTLSERVGLALGAADQLLPQPRSACAG